MHLQGKTALVTGATSGIGQAIAEAFAREGARVVITGRNAQRGKAVVEVIQVAGGSATFLAADLTSRADIDRLLRETHNVVGRVDILVNNAGIFPFAPTAQTDEATFDETITLNVKGPFYLTAALAPRMAEQGSGKIINITTMVAHVGMPGMALYGATKAALTLLTKSWAAEFVEGKEVGMQKHTWWQRLHWPEYGSELLGTAFVVFIALSAVTFTFGSGSPLASVLPRSSARRLMAGLILAASVPSVSISPLGKLSGAHLNPALSLAFWLQGKMHPHDLVGYLASQLLGAVLGAGVAVLVWRKRAARVHNGVTAPGMGYSIWSVLLIEMGLTCLLVLAIFLFFSSHRLMRWTPLMTWLLVAFFYWLVAPISGSSLNPARSFGPALVSWFWRDQWAYYLASPIGALLAVGLFRSLSMVGLHDVLTAKLFHAPRYRCIFKHVKAPQINVDPDGTLLTPRERD